MHGHLRIFFYVLVMNHPFLLCLFQFIHAIGLVEENHKIHLVGESMGGHTVGYYSSLYPEDVASVTMICPHGINFEDAQEQKKEILQTEEHFLLPLSMEEFRDSLKYITHKPKNIPDIILRGMYQVRSEKIDFLNRCKFIGSKGWVRL